MSVSASFVSLHFLTAESPETQACLERGKKKKSLEMIFACFKKQLTKLPLLPLPHPILAALEFCKSKHFQLSMANHSCR